MHSDGFKTLLDELKRNDADVEIKCAEGALISRRKASQLEIKGAHILAYKEGPQTNYVDVASVIAVHSFPTITAAKSGLRHTAVDIPRQG